MTVNITESKKKKYERRNYDVQTTLNTLQIIQPKMTWHSSGIAEQIFAHVYLQSKYYQHTRSETKYSK